MIFIALFIWAAAAQTGLNVFNAIDNTFPDPCVKNTGFTGDCNPSTELPWQSPTYLLPMNGASFQLAITGRFPVGAQFALSAATPSNNRGGASTTCGALPLATTGVTGVINADQTTVTLTVPVAWMTPAMEAETISRRLCWQPTASPTTAWAWTGFRVGVVYNCAAPGNSNCVRADRPTDPVLAAIQAARTFCCTSNGQTAVTVGQCINPNVESCCGATAVPPGLKCCSTIRGTVQWADAQCPCVRGTSGTDCPSTDRCCLPSKYPELSSSIDVGQCYNPNQQRCCNIGQAYDPGLLQCCALTGLQSPLVPCPCANDADCMGGQTGQILTDQKCCRQVVPSTNFVDSRCTKYTNYPLGQGSFVTQQCPGTCIDTRYQICCNGARCIRQFEKCCNSTCCNMFNGTCSTQYDRAPSKANWVNVQIPNKVCTIVEQLNPVNVFWVFILPTALLAATLSALALALVFASKVEHKARRALEKMMILAALVAILCGIPTFFSPAYKYGSVVLVISLFAIVSASARKIRVYVVAIVLHIILVLYLWDPFHGNDYLTLASDRTPFGRPDPRTAGLLHTVSRMHDSSMGNGHTSEPTALSTIPGSPQEVVWMEEACYRFYDYFKLDPYLRDTIRFDDPNIMFFGFCSRGWVIAILIAQGFVMIAVAAQVILHLIALMIRGGLLRGDHYYSGGAEEFDDASSHSS